MERITKRIGEKYACYAICEKECPDGIYADNAACMCTASKMAMKRLLEYEDTGLMPEQIVEQTNAGWIPVEERLPEEKKTVLVQWEKYDRHLNITLTYLDVMWLDDVEEKVFETINGVPNGKVIAWRPLPEPYQPEVTKP